MSEVSTTVEREERSEQLITVSSGWGALICALLGLHRWVATGSFDWWARLGLIAGLGLAVMWFWGVWPDLMERIRAWSRTGGWNTTGVAIALVVGLIFVNTAVRRRAFVKLDLTKNQRHTLSQRSKEVVKSLTQPVTVTAFLTARADPTVRDRLQQYADETDKFKWVAVDPIADRKTTMAKQPRLDEATLTGAVFEYAGKREDITSFSEKDITSALLKLTRTTKRKIVFLSGHGEPDVTTQGSGNTQRTMNEVVQSLRDVQWEIETLDLYPKDAKTPSPSETAVIVIAGPQRELSPEEQQRLDEYLNQGGRVLLLLDPAGPTQEKWLDTWGIKTGDNVVVGANPQGLIETVVQGEHASIKRLNGNRVIFLPMRPVAAKAPPPDKINITELIKSRDADQLLENFVLGRGNLESALSRAKGGPHSLAAIAEKSIGTGDQAKTGRLIVVGDNGFALDAVGRQLALYSVNFDLVGAWINYLGEEEALVAIPPKDEETEEASLSPEQGRMLSLIHFVDFPLLALALALLVYLKRR